MWRQKELGCSVSWASKLVKLGTLYGMNGEDQADGRSSSSYWSAFLQGPHSSAAGPGSIRVLQRWGSSGNGGEAQNAAFKPFYP